VVVVLVVTLFGLLVVKSTALTQADFGVSKALNQLHTGLLGTLTSGVYTIFSPAPAIAITAVTAAVIWLVSKNLRIAITFGVVVAVTWLPSAVVKALVHRVRPDAALLAHPFASQPTDASYPSGHAVFVTAIVMAAILLARGRSFRPVVIAVGAIVILLVTVALVIDGVHYATDVTASVIWAVGLAPAVLYVWNRLVVPLSYRRG
jgi:undecaprenyl-diphosphatase